MMLARQVPGATVCVSPDRYLGGVLAEKLGCTVHVLDDGFQHLELARDLDILVTTVGEIPNGRVIPLGRLREPQDAAARAHFLVVTDATAGAASAEAWALGSRSRAAARRTLGDPRCRDQGSGIRDRGSGIRRFLRLPASPIPIDSSHRCVSRMERRRLDDVRRSSSLFGERSRRDRIEDAERAAPMRSSRPTRMRCASKRWRRRSRCIACRSIVEFDPPDCAVRVGEGGARVRDAIEYWSVVTVRAIATRLPDGDRARVGIGAGPDVLRARSAASPRRADESRAVFSEPARRASGGPSRARRSRISARCC